jgi:N-acetylmuramoyl-L-alanine amidase
LKMKPSGMTGAWALAALAAGVLWAAPGTSTVLTTHSVFGRDYVAVTDVMRVFGLKAQALPARSYVLSSPHARVRFALDSREAEVQGVKYWLNAPPALKGGVLWFPAMDVVKTLDPLLRRSGLMATGTVRTIVLDPGHGGEDQGAHSRGGMLEKQFTLDMARRLGALLEEQGYRVLLTRLGDRFVPLDSRSAFARANRADLFISMHFNSAQPATEPCGAETYCLTPAGARSTSDKKSVLAKNDCVPQSANRFDNDNVMLAHHVQQALVARAGAAERGVKRARFEVLKDLDCPGALVECGFLSNPAEARRVSQASYRQQLAAAIASGIAGYRKSAGR